MRTVWRAVSNLAIVYLVLIAGPSHAYQLAGWHAAAMWLVVVATGAYVLGRIEELLISIRQAADKKPELHGLHAESAQVNPPGEWHFTGDYWQAFRSEEATQ